MTQRVYAQIVRDERSDKMRKVWCFAPNFFYGLTENVNRVFRIVAYSRPVAQCLLSETREEKQSINILKITKRKLDST